MVEEARGGLRYGHLAIRNMKLESNKMGKDGGDQNRDDGGASRRQLERH